MIERKNYFKIILIILGLLNYVPKCMALVAVGDFEGVHDINFVLDPNNDAYGFEILGHTVRLTISATNANIRPLSFSYVPAVGAPPIACSGMYLTGTNTIITAPQCTPHVAPLGGAHHAPWGIANVHNFWIRDIPALVPPGAHALGVTPGDTIRPGVIAIGNFQGGNEDVLNNLLDQINRLNEQTMHRHWFWELLNYLFGDCFPGLSNRAQTTYSNKYALFIFGTNVGGNPTYAVLNPRKWNKVFGPMPQGTVEVQLLPNTISVGTVDLGGLVAAVDYGRETAYPIGIITHVGQCAPGGINLFSGCQQITISRFDNFVVPSFNPVALPPVF